MKTILIINDGSTAVAPAAKLALQLARIMQAGVLIAQTFCQTKALAPKVLAGENRQQTSIPGSDELQGMLQKLNEEQAGFRPGITIADLRDTDAGGLAELLLRTDCALIVRGYGQMPAGRTALDLQSLLNKLRCPLLLVPERWSSVTIERVTYITDLRYCRLNIMRYLAALAGTSQASLSLAHLSAQGLTPIEENYGRALFADVARHVPGCSVRFNNIRERDIHRAVDVIINDLHNDLLVLINHRFHFKEIIGERLTNQLPERINIPLLLFPI